MFSINFNMETSCPAYEAPGVNQIMAIRYDLFEIRTTIVAKLLEVVANK